MKRKIVEFVARCVMCQLVKIEHQRSNIMLQPLDLLKCKWESISMDFIVGLPQIQGGHESLWVIVDRLIKLGHFLPLKTTYKFLHFSRLFIFKMVRLHGVPSSIVFEQDPKFTYRFWKVFLSGVIKFSMRIFKRKILIPTLIILVENTIQTSSEATTRHALQAPQRKPPALEETLSNFMKETHLSFEQVNKSQEDMCKAQRDMEQDQTLINKNTEASIKNLQMQIRHLSRQMTTQASSSKEFIGNIMDNLKNEMCKPIELITWGR